MAIVRLQREAALAAWGRSSSQMIECSSNTPVPQPSLSPDAPGCLKLLHGVP